MHKKISFLATVILLAGCVTTTKFDALIPVSPRPQTVSKGMLDFTPGTGIATVSRSKPVFSWQDKDAPTGVTYEIKLVRPGVGTLALLGQTMKQSELNELPASAYLPEILLQKDGISGLSYQMPFDLEPDAVYGWSVRRSGGRWSTMRTKTTDYFAAIGNVMPASYAGERYEQVSFRENFDIFLFRTDK
jgi:hypothetical protein